MPSISVRQPSFAGGELAPTLHGRSDVARYAIGLAKCSNFFVAPHGVLLNRAGLIHVKQTKYSGVAGDASVKLIPFIFSSTEAYVLEFGDLYMRVHKLGANVEASPGVPYELITTYTKNEVQDLKWAQLGNNLTLVHPNHTPTELVRIAANSWTLTNISFALVASSFAAGTKINGGYPVTSGHLAKNWQYAVTQEYTTPEGIVRETLPTIINASPFDIFAAYGLGDVVNSGGSTFTAIQAGTGHTPPVSGNDNWWNEGVVAYTDTPLPLKLLDGIFTAGTILHRNIYKGRNGVFGFIGSATPGLADNVFKDDGIAPDFTSPPPKGTNPFGTENPSVVAYFEQRRVFARTPSKPQTLWLSSSGDYRNFDSPDFPTDASAIEITLASNQFEEIRSLVPGRELLVLTQTSEWSVGGQQGPVTPSNVQAQLHSRRGSSALNALPVGSSILFAQARGTSVRDLQFEFQSGSYTGSEVSLLAQHLFPAAVSTDGRNYAATIRDWAYSLVPYSIAWIVRSDGVLLGLTYNKEQEIIAWHQHSTQGSFESICAIPEDQEDAVYVSVLRNGLRFIERMATRNVDWENDQRKCCFLDCAQTFDVTGAPSTTFTLRTAQNTVWGLVDGAVVGPLPVVGGVVTLDDPVEIAIFGLLYTSEAQLLDLVIPNTEGRTKIKNMWKGVVEVYASRGLKAGRDAAHLRDLILRGVADNYGAPALYTGSVEIGIEQALDKAGRATIQQVDPLPATIVAVTREVVVGGD